MFPILYIKLLFELVTLTLNPIQPASVFVFERSTKSEIMFVTPMLDCIEQGSEIHLCCHNTIVTVFYRSN